MNFNVVSAIFKRNFFAYFANPTGYVFICVFVGLSSIAAFWNPEFFVANLANLDQLNKSLPYILLVFIPAITMSLWAEERRQGTDELLLTIPAGDFDVVLGKYLSAVAIYTVALAFSFVCNFIILSCGGSPDPGLLFGTYVGYWVVGLAMLAIGMVASFLTGNLTVGFVLGALLNAPLVFADLVDGLTIPWFGDEPLVVSLRGWSAPEMFRDFGRGVISISSVVYFGMIVAVCLYLSVVLISRRHWAGRSGSMQGWHYFIRAISLVAIAVAVVMLCERTSVRADVTSERLNSLAAGTKKLIGDLDPKHGVHIDAYLSKDVPESYVPTKLNLVSALRELKAIGGGKLDVHVHEIEPLSEEADRAEKLYQIMPRQVASRSQGGAVKLDEIYLGVAFTSGLNKVVVPFFDYGVPVEYELVRSIATVAQKERKKLGVLTTDARLFGGFDQTTMGMSQNQAIIDELEKQYDVKQVSPDQPITEKLDVLLAVQPSSLSQPQMDNFIAAVKSGVPTAIFEDPFPRLDPSVPGTSAPKQAPQQNPFMGGGPPPQPKGNINQLWSMLGVDFSGDNIIWQSYNPYPRFPFEKEFVFVDAAASTKPVFSDKDPTTKGLQQLLFLFPGSITPLNATTMKIEPLVTTGEQTGTVAFGEIVQRNFMGQISGLNPRPRRLLRPDHYALAVHIRGKLRDEPMEMADDQPEPSPIKPEEKKPEAAASSAKVEEKPGEVPPAPAVPATPAAAEAAKKTDEVKPAAKDIDVILVADSDVLYSDFFMLRNQANDPNRDFNLNLDNVTFVLNVLDELANDDRFIEIRKRRPQHRSLEKINQITEAFREETMQKEEKFIEESQKAQDDAEKRFQEDIDAIKKRYEQQKNLTTKDMLINVQVAQQARSRELTAVKEKAKKDLDRQRKQLEREQALKIRAEHNWFKTWAVLLPPIPPLLVGLGVYFNRRAREREGVARSRLR